MKFWQNLDLAHLKWAAPYFGELVDNKIHVIKHVTCRYPQLTSQGKQKMQFYSEKV